MQYINPNSIIQNAMRNKINPMKYTAPYVPKSNGLPTDKEINNVLNNYMTTENGNVPIEQLSQIQQPAKPAEQKLSEKFDMYIPKQEPTESPQSKQILDLLPKKIEGFIEPYKHDLNSASSNKIIYVVVIVILCFIVFKLYFKVMSLQFKIDLLESKSESNLIKR